MANTDKSTSVVFRENDTGKIRVKGAVKIEHVTESPADAAEIAAAFNALLDLLEDAGINDDVDE